MEGTLARLRAELAAMERLQADADTTAPPPPALLAIIDRMLDAASARLESGARAAHEGASQTVAAAIRDAAALLEGAGLEPVSALRRIAPAVPEGPQLRRPRRASTLSGDWEPAAQTTGPTRPRASKTESDFDLAFEKFWWSDAPNRHPRPDSNRNEHP